MTLRILVAVLFIAASISTALAVKKVPTPAPTQTQTRKSLPLTEGECRGLGGNVVTANGCGSPAKACETADKNGVLHRACIDDKKN